MEIEMEAPKIHFTGNYMKGSSEQTVNTETVGISKELTAGH